MCPKWTAVYACAEGIVDYVGWTETTGLMVVLDHNFGQTRYLHLDAIGVVYGQFVNRGDLLGRSGDSGLAFGPHLHVDLSPEGEPEDNGYGGRVNPEPYLTSR